MGGLPTDAGFHFRYRLCGDAPTVRRFRCLGSGSLAAGDLVALREGEIVPARGTRAPLLGAALERRTPRGYVNVVVDADAVYGVADGRRRAAGTTLVLAGSPEGLGARHGRRGDLEVVVDCSAGMETLVRIAAGRHDPAHVPTHAERATRLLAPRATGGRTAATGAAAPVPSRLPSELERELVIAAAAGDVDARGQLVEAFLPAIGSIARLYRRSMAVSRDELLQEGVVGLLRALGRFDPELGTPFWAYAAWWVRQAMQQLVAELGRPAALSDRALRGLARIREARRRHLQEHGREPTMAELTVATALPREQIESLLAVERPARALEEPVGGEAGAGATLREMLPDPVAEDAFDSVLDHVDVEDLRQLADTLGDREREILFDHFGLGREPKTLREIGNHLGVSAERVRQIEAQALTKLRAAVEHVA